LGSLRGLIGACRDSQGLTKPPGSFLGVTGAHMAVGGVIETPGEHTGP